MTAYYNEIDRFCCDWLSNLMDAGQITPGKIDDRSIVDVRPDDLAGFERVHFFAGIGGWDYSLRLAGWPAGRPVWTGSCPCQPFSLAGKQKGFDDERHLWPVLRDLIRLGSPATFFGEQVASAAEWLRVVRGDLEALGYAVGAMPIQAASAGADHLRDRYWFVANADELGASEERQQRSGKLCWTRSYSETCGCNAWEPRYDSESHYCSECECWSVAYREGERLDGSEGAAGQAGRDRSENGGLEWIIGADGKARRVKSGIRLLAHGVPNRVGLLRGFGNAIDPRPAAAFIRATMCDLTSRK